jgi:DNA-binding response OmpR family regulator
MNAKATGGVLLLVEDDDSIGRLVKAYLEQQDGWRVVWLRSGEEAVAELRRHPVRLVVLDIGLPGIDGFEVCRQMRAQSKVPIIMLTGALFVGHTVAVGLVLTQIGRASGWARVYASG